MLLSEIWHSVFWCNFKNMKQISNNCRLLMIIILYMGFVFIISSLSCKILNRYVTHIIKYSSIIEQCTEMFMQTNSCCAEGSVDTRGLFCVSSLQSRLYLTLCWHGKWPFSSWRMRFEVMFLFHPLAGEKYNIRLRHYSKNYNILYPSLLIKCRKFLLT